LQSVPLGSHTTLLSCFINLQPQDYSGAGFNVSSNGIAIDMRAKKLTLTYLITYLAIGGLGFLLFPDQTLTLFLSDGIYGDIMPRITGMFMCALSFLIFRILKNEDWHYYSATIYVRSIIVFILIWLFYKSSDPMLLVVTGIVLIGLIPSIVIHFMNNG